MPDRNIKITLQYDGSRYDGWQKQGNTDKTIQGKLEQILEKMAGRTVEVHGSGRTDASPSHKQSRRLSYAALVEATQLWSPLIAAIAAF